MSGTACGPNWLPAPVRRYLFGWFFEASCLKHDEGYREGGSEFRRWACDYKFFRAMLRDTGRTSGPSKILKLGVAITFYIIVVTTGWTSFNYKA